MASDTVSVGGQGYQPGAAAELGGIGEEPDNYKLSVTTVGPRYVFLTEGVWQLFGLDAGIVYYRKRKANADGTLATGQTAPISLSSGTAGTSGSNAFDKGSGAATGDPWVPADSTKHVNIIVPPGKYVLLYLQVDVAGAAGVQWLLGPYKIS